MDRPAGTAERRGLSGAEARERLQRFGPNALPQRPPRPLWRRFLGQFHSPLIYILLFALLVDLAVWLGEGTRGLPLESFAIGAILLLNATLGTWQEHKAEGALAKLKQLAAPQVWALRDGALGRLPAADLVPGDVIRLEAGDRVPADAVAHEAENLMLDESLLTGESIPVEKSGAEEIYAGTLVVRGKVYAEVNRTGAASAMGRLAEMLGELEAERTPLERRLEAFGRRVAGWVLLVAAVIAVGGVWAEGLGRVWQVVLFAVALAVAAVPEGLPAVLTLTLTLGVQRMGRRKAVVRRLVAVEALGSVTVVATDKTGTLTENRLQVRDVDSPDRFRAVRAMVLANDAEAPMEAGDPLELALLHYAELLRQDPAALRAAHPRRSSRSFDSAWKFMRASVMEAGRVVSYLKGAPEALLARCDMVEEERRAWDEKIDAYAAEGYRLLAVAWAEGQRETGLTWLGLILLWDPPRPEVPAAIRMAREAGIRVVMVTGDHPGTALTVARRVGIGGGAARVVTGVELERMSRDELRAVVREAHVFARVGPEHKLGIIEALQANGDIVAVTGDGVNDAPALKRADVGVAMGRRGSDVSREVADLVLLDDNFATIVAAVEEGRSIYENIQKFIRFLFSTNLSELLVVAVGAVVAFLLDLRNAAGGLLVPLTAVQLLWINLISDGAPALALGLDRNPGVMRRPPRDPRAPLLDPSSLRFIVLSGVSKALVAFAILGLLPRLLDQPLEVTATANFLFMAAGQLLFAYPARHTELHPPHNLALHVAIAVSFVAQLPLVWIPALGSVFGTVPLPPVAWAWVGGSVTLAWGLAQALNRILWSKGSFGAPS
ncbi:MAG TPA: cation-translocating P-type ATPase [Gemmatimonadales bacterium]|nr:cation-translocating P-type ATPase [Gemmatimonadales bacterium]